MTTVPFPPRTDQRLQPAVTDDEDTAVYTIADVARLLSLSTNSVYAMVHAGQIPARKCGGQWRIPKRRFTDWLNDPVDTGHHDQADRRGRR